MVNHSNRGRLTVNVDGKWRLYTNVLPAGSAVIGTVTRNDTDTGALVLVEATGIYLQVNAGVVRGLPQHKVAGALRDQQS